MIEKANPQPARRALEMERAYRNLGYVLISLLPIFIAGFWIPCVRQAPAVIQHLIIKVLNPDGFSLVLVGIRMPVPTQASIFQPTEASTRLLPLNRSWWLMRQIVEHSRDAFQGQ